MATLMSPGSGCARTSSPDFAAPDTHPSPRKQWAPGRRGSSGTHENAIPDAALALIRLTNLLPLGQAGWAASEEEAASGRRGHERRSPPHRPTPRGRPCKATSILDTPGTPSFRTPQPANWVQFVCITWKRRKGAGKPGAFANSIGSAPTSSTHTTGAARWHRQPDCRCIIRAPPAVLMTLPWPRLLKKPAVAARSCRWK